MTTICTASAPKMAGVYRRRAWPRVAKLPPAGRTVTTLRTTAASSNTDGHPFGRRRTDPAFPSGYRPKRQRPDPEIGRDFQEPAWEMPKPWVRRNTPRHRKAQLAMKPRLVRIATALATLAALAAPTGAPRKFH